ncbi:MAG: hypothetical protein IKO94_09685 [Selenomonadaceae bacterium]|nr:hypothetical protein [Selenomonadaceae bacterium]
MPITIDFSSTDAHMIQQMADRQQISMEEYIHRLTLQAIREAKALAEIDHRLEQVKQGKVMYKTMDELEAMAK